MKFESESVDLPLPIIMGNEEETGMLISIENNFDEPYDLADNLPRYIPSELLERNDQYLTNGFRVYAGGYSGEKKTNIERATPECIMPSDVNKYIRVGEVLIDKITENYAQETSRHSDQDVIVRMQRRVVDSRSNRKGCHDNFGLPRNADMEISSDLRPHIAEFIATRLFITGAGHIDDDIGPYYSQKITGLEDVIARGWKGTVAGVLPDNDTTRLEIRCNDINISDWATQARLGGMGILLALDETGELDILNKYTNNESDAKYLNRIKNLNEMYMQDDGVLEVSTEQLKAVDYQQRVAELAMKRLGLHVEVPYEYFKIAEEIYEYCDDFKEVVRGGGDISQLSDRSDWAAKMTVVRSSIEKDRDFGIEREYLDIKAQAMDLKYDYREIVAHDGETISTSQGYGYKLRDKDFFRSTIKKMEVLKAYKIPPNDTRASLRSELLTDHNINVIDWSSLNYTINGMEKDSQNIQLSPRETTLSAENQKKIRPLYLKS